MTYPSSPRNRPQPPADGPDHPLSWVCAFCKRLRLCPYTRPILDGSLKISECPLCGDARVTGVDAEAARKALAHIIREHLL